MSNIQPPSKQRAGITLLLIAGPMVLVLLAVIVLSRIGVIDDGPFAHRVPKVPPPPAWIAAAGELSLAGNQVPTVSPLKSTDWDWEISGRYSTGKGDDLVEHDVRLFGSTDRVKDVIGDYDVDEIGGGYCGSSILGRFLTRQCGVTRGSIVAVVESPPTGPSDEDLIRYATSLADVMSNVR
ncbi:hypothetical protein [Kribbella sp. NPDC004875]|uniref:hypothetical protein n=1 Tax=Kribbella sp. NPDC004875 TaxID=3364107 RepID=UPI0036C3BBA2